MIVAGTLPGAAGAQEIPDSSLNDLFPVAGHEAVRLAGGGSGGLPGLVFSLPGHGTSRADEDPDPGRVIVLTTIGTVAGDVAGLFLAYGCGTSWCDSFGEELLGFFGAATAVVGGAAGGAILAGGDPVKSLVGSIGGILGGVLLGAAAGDGYGFSVFLVVHAGVTAVTALH